MLVYQFRHFPTTDRQQWYYSSDDIGNAASKGHPKLTCGLVRNCITTRSRAIPMDVR